MTIDLTTKIPLGRVKQKIHIIGDDIENPILLFLHGGPGVPDRSGVVKRKDLQKDFTLVAWDQRGTGGSYWGVKKDSLTVDRLVEDARELCEYLCATLGQDKLFLLCGSWGTQLGTILAHRYPARIAGYVGSGQTVNGILNEQYSWEFALREAEKAGNAEDIAKLNEVGPPVQGQYRGGFKGLMAQRNIMKKYGGYSQKDKERAKLQGFFKAFALPMLRSEEYTPLDLLGILWGYKKVLTVMWPRLIDYDFTRSCNKFEMPYYIFQGRHDNNTPSALVEAFYEAIEAPRKALVWFENSAHGPGAEERELYLRLLREYLL
ncbi:MAG: alpha/beta hydrolase [Oscillospiraceae bacterium]|nr:alpha/beta hydrolase [Oscillospiraceae bacterium]